MDCLEVFISEIPLKFFPSTKEYHQCLHHLTAFGKRRQKGVNAIKKRISQEKRTLLSPREKEVARFAQKRLISKEIADKLFISEATVRTVMKSIYSKLGVHSKSELSAMDL